MQKSPRCCTAHLDETRRVALRSQSRHRHIDLSRFTRHTPSAKLIRNLNVLSAKRVSKFLASSASAQVAEQKTSVFTMQTWKSSSRRYHSVQIGNAPCGMR